jgi:serine/threonine protein kinase
MPILFDNRYHFIKDLGSGGFGKVFLAKEENSNRLVAIKQLINLDKARQESLIREMKVISHFNHPNIVTYFHHFIQDEIPYFVMEFCPGGSLSGKISKTKHIDSSKALDWVSTLALTLQTIHDKGIVHHDIKPGNILFKTVDDIIKLSDFGVANTGIGTRSYMCPEALMWNEFSKKDPRADIYALGVTLLELLIGFNPFANLTVEQIIELHDRADFSISNLPSWQQEIVLKAINKIPELRFQTMKELAEAINAKHVPIVFNKDVFKAGDVAAKSEYLLKTKKWSKAFSLLRYADKQLLPSVSIIRLLGKYYLLQQKIEYAKHYFERALQLNPRLDVQKELGWINLELKKYPTAISLLSDHLHRNPSDYEAYNLLIQCFYETNRYESAMDLSKTLLDSEGRNLCFANNYYISCLMHNLGQTFSPESVMKVDRIPNHFLDYNFSVILENKSSHDFAKKPTLKSKLLFMDYRFNTFTGNTLYFTDSNIPNGIPEHSNEAIIKIGRAYAGQNDIEISCESSVSRRHCLIINCKDDVWIYDLASTGTYVDEQKLTEKMPLNGKHIIRIGKSEFAVTNDKSLLF